MIHRLPTYGCSALFCPTLPSVTLGIAEVERQKGQEVLGGVVMVFFLKIVQAFRGDGLGFMYLYPEMALSPLLGFLSFAWTESYFLLLSTWLVGSLSYSKY